MYVCVNVCVCVGEGLASDGKIGSTGTRVRERHQVIIILVVVISFIVLVDLAGVVGEATCLTGSSDAEETVPWSTQAGVLHP